VTPAVPSRATIKIFNIDIPSVNLLKIAFACSLAIPDINPDKIVTREARSMFGVVGVEPTQRYIQLLT